jgi:hypothetical protein
MKDHATCSLKLNDNDDQSNSNEDSKWTNNDMPENGKTTGDETLSGDLTSKTLSTHDTSIMSSDQNLVKQPLVRDGFAFVQGWVMANYLQEDGFAGWDEFASSWNDLPLDNYMADGGRYRRRRYATLRITPEAIIHLPPQPFRQSKEYNLLNGGIDRWFEPVRDEILDGVAMQAILRRCRTWFNDLSPNVVAWYVDIHQFRIEVLGEDVGKPTPEGIHRDGADWVLVFMINLNNIQGGITTIYDAERRALISFTLAEPLDVAVLDDRRVLHDVSPVKRQNPDQPAYRDVLIINFREKDTLC